MAVSYFIDIIRGNALFTVEYETEGSGAGPSYSPIYGADSGDPLLITIVDAWSEEYGQAILSDEERENIEEEIAGTHVFDYDDDLEYDR